MKKRKSVAMKVEEFKATFKVGDQIRGFADMGGEITAIGERRFLWRSRWENKEHVSMITAFGANWRKP